MEIKYNGGTYDGTAEGDHGVFTRFGGAVYAGSIAYGCACIGVATFTDGGTDFAECDANGVPHGRWLACWADGETVYRLCKHGSVKEGAVLFADGTCYYDGKACSADFAPFVALQAMVVPIKARPPLVPPHSRLYAAFFAPTARQSLQSAIVLAFAEVGDDSRRQGAHLPPPPVACMARASHSTPAAAKQMHRASNLDDTPGRKDALRTRHKPHA
jgi:hypothetical protein